METYPTPIVIVSGSGSMEEVERSFKALEAGALLTVPRPPGIGHVDFERASKEFLKTIKAMAEVKLVRRWSKLRTATSLPTRENRRNEPACTGPIQCIAIGASTGGPVALQVILSSMSKDVPVPVLVVQHIAPGFVEGFVEWLCQTTGHRVRIPHHGTLVESGHVYVAPDGSHMQVGEGGRIVLVSEPVANGLCPSIGPLFRSVADVYRHRCVGVLLTGMGRDGAPELLIMKRAGAATIAQDEVTSVIYGMPAEAIRLGAAKLVLPLQEIGPKLTMLANGQ